MRLIKAKYRRRISAEISVLRWVQNVFLGISATPVHCPIVQISAPISIEFGKRAYFGHISMCFVFSFILTIFIKFY